MPSFELPSDAVSVALRPMRLPWTTLLAVAASVIRMPSVSLPEMTLPAPAAVPPIVFPVAPFAIRTPSLGVAAVERAGRRRCRCSCPGRRCRSSRRRRCATPSVGVARDDVAARRRRVPPIVLPVGAERDQRSPLCALPSAAVPAAFEADVVAETTLPSCPAPMDLDAVAVVAGDHVAGAGGRCRRWCCSTRRCRSRRPRRRCRRRPCR